MSVPAGDRLCSQTTAIAPSPTDYESATTAHSTIKQSDDGLCPRMPTAAGSSHGWTWASHAKERPVDSVPTAAAAAWADPDLARHS